MNICVDARFYGTEHTGLGRYTSNVMAHLPQVLPGHTLKVLLRKKYYDTLKLPKNCVKILCDIPHYSLTEQIQLPLLLNSLHCDLLYTFHFNTPIFSRLPTIVTVHDLIKSHFTGFDTTTRAPWLYEVKRAGYNLVIKHTLTRSLDIITPTNSVKNDILALFPTVAPEHIHPIPEAPDLAFRNPPRRVKEAHIHQHLPSNYLLFVGNAYPHKNLGLLLDALSRLPKQHLVIVAKETPFLSRTLSGRDLSRIHVLSGLSDTELVTLYRRAQALVTPSLMEGYGLPGLEALMVGTPVIASNIPVYREVYGKSVTYFDPQSPQSLINAILDPKSYILSHKPNLTRTWSDVATEIAEVIHEHCHRL